MNETHFVIVENGVVVNRVVADTAFESNWIQHDTAQIGWKYDGTNFIPPPDNPPSLPNRISKLAFIARFTPDEYVGIVTARKTDPTVEAWYDLMFLADSINLEDQRTIDGVNFMVTKNLITAARASEILAIPIDSSER